MSINGFEKKFNRICEKILTELYFKENKIVNEKGDSIEATPIGTPKLFEHYTTRSRSKLENRIVRFEKIMELAPRSANSYILGVGYEITPIHMTRDQLYIVPIQYYRITKTDNLD